MRACKATCAAADMQTAPCLPSLRIYPFLQTSAGCCLSLQAVRGTATLYETGGMIILFDAIFSVLACAHLPMLLHSWSCALNDDEVPLTASPGSPMQVDVRCVLASSAGCPSLMSVRFGVVLVYFLSCCDTRMVFVCVCTVEQG